MRKRLHRTGLNLGGFLWRRYGCPKDVIPEKLMETIGQKIMDGERDDPRDFIVEDDDSNDHGGAGNPQEGVHGGPEHILFDMLQRVMTGGMPMDGGGVGIGGEARVLRGPNSMGFVFSSTGSPTLSSQGQRFVHSYQMILSWVQEN
jgi:hypothetical protein